ncbi:MAG: hypothetical protein ACOCVQ_00675 [Bacillota bacterium]
MSRRFGSRHSRPLRQGVYFGILALILTLILNTPSREITERLDLLGAVAVLVVIVGIGVAFDMLGVAAAAAHEAPLNAMAARRITGAVQAQRLVRNAERVSTICADVVGDTAGTVAGAAGAAIVLRLVLFDPILADHSTAVHTGVLSLVAGLTVGGKAACKCTAINRWTNILMFAGRIMWWVETYLHISILEGDNSRGRR